MRRTPQRTCIGCRTARGKKELVRVVHTPEDRFVLDPSGKAAGRGAYVCPSVACLDTALKRKSFNRAFRQAVPEEAVQALEDSMRDYLRRIEDGPQRADQ